MRKQSSWHPLNNDTWRKNKLERIIVRLGYPICNWLNNLFPNILLDKSIKIKSFSIKDLVTSYGRLDEGASPSRKISDLFWMSLAWDTIKQNLGTINILDIGCGSGSYYLKLQNFSNNSIASYKGIDVKDSQNQALFKLKNVTIQKYDGLHIGKHIDPNTSLIMTQSAIEHFDEDITIFKEIHNFIQKTDKPIMQIHLFPSSACLKLYPYHGARQYTPRTISNITKIFKQNSRSTLFLLGGKNSIQLHYQFITKPLKKNNKNLRQTKLSEYEKLCYDAIHKDFNDTNHTKIPIFWALIIESNMKNFLS